jgi:hypothetical protein
MSGHGSTGGLVTMWVCFVNRQGVPVITRETGAIFGNTGRTIVNEKDAFGCRGGDILGLRTELYC